MSEQTVNMVVKPRLDAVVVRPGDTLVIRVGTGLTHEAVDEIKARVAEVLPGIKPVIIAAEQILVYRPGGSDD